MNIGSVGLPLNKSIEEYGPLKLENEMMQYSIRSVKVYNLDMRRK